MDKNTKNDDKILPCQQRDFVILWRELTGEIKLKVNKKRCSLHGDNKSKIWRTSGASLP